MTKTHYYVLQAFEVAEDQIVVAKTAKKARKWYKKNITDDDVFDLKEVRVCGMEELYYADDSRTKQMTLKECIDDHLKHGDKVPFLAVTTDY
ncbi:minor structural protein [Lysinibacillus phage vB_LspM-01]|nr:minor structural protein [Lysinibacillus phage vB_LspM-01]